jgi:predicted MFS family arabinose efflux permease
MIAGRDYWVWIWVGILVLGVAGFVPAVNWGRYTNWKNMDEILRGAGTIFVSVGMILLLLNQIPILGSLLLFFALIQFVAAFIVGRKSE